MLQQTEVQKSVYTAFRASPFAMQESIKEVYVSAGKSIQDIVNESIEEEWQAKYMRVVLNDEVINPEDYALTFVKESDVVAMVLVPQDGDVGQIFKAIAIIAIVIAVTVLMPEGAPLWVTMAAASAAGLAASLALNALFPPPVPGVPAINSSSGASEDPVYGFNKSGNSINKYGAIPRIYGCRKVFPQHAIAPYIIAKGSDQYLYQAFTAGYGPLNISDIRIGDNAIGYYKDVEYYVHESFEAGDQLKIVKEDNWQDPYSIKLEYNSSNVISTTDDANKATLAIQFPQGLFVIDRTNGNRLNTKVYFQINIRSSGSSTWNPLTNYSPTITDGSLNSTVTSSQWNMVGSQYQADTANYSTITELPDSSTVPNGAYRTLMSVTGDDFGNTIVYYQDYQNSYSVATSTDTIVVEKVTSRPFFTNVNVEFPSAGKWEIQIIRKEAYTNNGSWMDISTWTTSDQAYTESYISSLRSVKNVPPLVPDKPISLIELKIKATDQLNGAVNNLSCIVTSILPIWNGSTWVNAQTRNPAWAYLDVLRGNAAKTPMSDSRIDFDSFLDWADWCDETQPNFAFTPPTIPDNTNTGYVTNLYYTILFRVPDTDGLNYWVNMLNTATLTRNQVQQFFLKSAEAATINRACCDLEVTSQTTAWEVLRLISATGYATPSQNGGKYSITIDKTRTTPVQIFTPKNIKSFSGNMSYHIQPHALRISYTRTNETDTEEIIVYDDGYNADGSGGNTQATIFEEMKLVGISRYNQAYTIGRRALAQGRLRIEKFTISCDVENILVTRGSLVRLAHDVPKIGSGTGKIVNVSGSTITIDENFTITSGSIYAYVRHLDGTQTSHTLSGISGNTATISGTGMHEGDLIVYGYLNSVVIDCLVKSIHPSNDLTATLELVPYAPAIYTAETDAIPARDPYGNWTGGTSGGGTNTGNKLTPGLIASLNGSYQITYDNKTPRISVTLSWTAPSTGGKAFKYKVWYEDTNGWRLLGETVDLTYKAFNEYIFTDANGDLVDLNDKDLKFAVSGVGSDGSSLNPAYAKQVIVSPSIPVPKELATLTATAKSLSIQLDWTFTDDPFDTDYIELWASTTNNRNNAVRIAKISADVLTYNHSGLTTGTTYYYWIKAADGKGNFSAWFPDTTTSSVNAIVGGVPGAQATQVALYQWSMTEPDAPYGVSTFTWATGANADYTGGNGWEVSIPANPGIPSIQLWSATKLATGASGDATSTIDWTTGVSVQAISLNGGPGTQNASPTVYQWAITIPSGPTGTSTYTWASGTFTPIPSGWSETPGTSPSGGYTLWGAQVNLMDSGTVETSTINWVTASITARGYSGLAGGSSRVCYTKTSLSSLNSTPSTITTSGSASFPPNDSWGSGTVWQATPPSITAGESVYQSDGIYSPESGNTVWNVPYLSTLKVGSLSAISANLGTITSGTITGATIQTASSGARIAMTYTNNLLSAYGSDGTTITAQMGGTSGSLYAKAATSLQPAISGYATSSSAPAIFASNTTGIGIEVVSNNTNVAILGKAYTASGNNHAIRGTHYAGSGTSGLVGSSVGWDFYAEGAGGNYGPFTGAHDCLTQIQLDIKPGKILVDINCVSKRNISNTIFEVEESSVANQIPSGVMVSNNGLLNKASPSAFINKIEEIDVDGMPQTVIVMNDLYDQIKNQYNYCTMNAVGEGQVYVCGENGDITAGDLIVTSSVPGVGMKQADDIVRNYTVAKARESMTFSNANEQKLIACIYLCG